MENSAIPTDKPWLFGLTLDELERIAAENGMPRFAARQIASWLYRKGADSIGGMTDLSLKNREKLAGKYELGTIPFADVQRSADGTKKYLFPTLQGRFIESAYIPDGDRATLCVSSQSGCRMGCRFCMTARQGFAHHLTAGEILNQIRSIPESDRLTNVVYMGMGEPLLNLRETTRALEMLNHDKGMDFSPRRITVSTCGIKAGLRELGDSGLAFLAVSLHAPNQELRAKIMPKAANWHLDDLMATLENYPLKTREHITFEYLLLGGVNDQPEHARELAKLVSRVKGKLNLIAYNPSETQLYKAPTEADILAFEKILWSKGITAILRKSKGQDIKAACGQLKSEWERGKGGGE